MIRARLRKRGLAASHPRGVPAAVARLVADANGETDLGGFGGRIMTKPSADRRPLVWLPGERPPVPGIPNPIVVRARAEETGGAFEVFEVGLSGEGTDLVAGPPPTTHREHEEIFYVLEGQVEFYLDNDLATAPTGTLIVVPRGTRLHFRGRPGSRLLVVAIPGGMAGFFEELGAGREAGRAEAEVRAALAEKYDTYP
jgi:mannose-6-phosphate isomerase-like protein (cupin superfamily)